MKNDIAQVLGAGGGSDSSSPVESPNTLLTLTTARVLLLTSDGEIGGLADQVNPQKSVYLNNVPVMNDDGTMNFASVQVDERYGLPSQTVIPGFTDVSSAFNVSSKVTTAAPVVYTTSTSAPDAVRITIRFPALYKVQDNGDTTGTSVQFQIFTRLGAGSFTMVKDVTKTDKCTSPADVDYLINRPSGLGTWSIKLVRVTADNATTTLANDIYFQVADEIQYVQLPYDDRAVVGITLTAAATGSDFPTISLDTYGELIQVPSNYTVATRSYSGAWDGTFRSLPEVCSNPAWVLYDLLTHPRRGMGIAASDVDQYSFYDAAVYNDGLVPALVNGEISGTEPRYDFNYQFMTQDTAWTTIQNVAAAFGSVVYTSGNRVKLVQDRPTGVSRLITNSNVIDGSFEYASAQKNTRQSACIVYWNDPSQNYLSVPVYYEDEDGTDRYGLSTQSITGLGVTSEGQAMRLAKWTVDTSLNNTDTVLFKVGFANAGIEPGEVLKIADIDYAMTLDLEAKVVSCTASTVTFDRAITVTSGTVMDIVGSDGTTIFTRTITSFGTLSTVSFSGSAITVSTGADVIFTGAISPRLFKVTDVKEDSPGVYIISAVLYDPNKFGRVDSTPTGVTPVYQVPGLIPSPVVNLTFREGAQNIDNVIKRSLMISWSRPVEGTVKNYLLRYRRSSTSWIETDLNTTSFEIDNVLEGTYEAQVYPRSTFDVMGPVAEGSYTISAAGGGASLLNAPTSLQLTGGGASFTGVDINIQWTNPTSNATVAATLKDFEVRFIETTGSTTVRTTYVPAVAAGLIQTFSYTYSMNTHDGGPRRAVQIQVRCRDASNNLSSPLTVTFSNAAPATITPTLTGGVGSIFATYTKPTEADFEGVLMWASLTSGFTPSSSNLVYDGSDSVINVKSLGTGAHYVRFAAYDSFGKSYAGTGLNLSAEQTVNPLATAGIPSGATLPASAGEGDAFVNTTDGKVYIYHSGSWVDLVASASIGAGAVGTINIASAAVTAAKTAIAAIDPSSGNLTANSVTANAILAGSVGAQALAAGSVTASKLFVADLENLCTNPVAAVDTDGWEPGTIGRYDLSSSFGAGCYAFGTNQRDTFFGQKFNCTAGDQFHFSVDTQAQGGATGLYDMRFGFESFDSAGNQLAFFPEACARPRTTSGVSSISGDYTVQPGAFYLRIWVQLDGDPTTGFTSGSSTMYFRNLQVRRKNNGTLIVDGAITADKMAANSVTGGSIVGGTITGDKVAGNTITGTNIAGSTITGTNIAGSTITADKMSVTDLSAINANLGNVHGGQYTTGAYTGYAWPAAGAGGGTYLGTQGLLMGSANDGRYIQITYGGDLIAPTFSIVAGVATLSGNLSAAGGTFNGTLTAGALTVAGSGIFSPAYASRSSFGLTGSYASVATTSAVNPGSTGAVVIVVTIKDGDSYTFTGGSDSGEATTTYYPNTYRILRNGSQIGVFQGSSFTLADTPGGSASYAVQGVSGGGVTAGVVLYCTITAMGITR